MEISKKCQFCQFAKLRWDPSYQGNFFECAKNSTFAGYFASAMRYNSCNLFEPKPAGEIMAQALRGVWDPPRNFDV